MNRFISLLEQEDPKQKQHGYKFNVIDINQEEEKIQKAELHLFKEHRPAPKSPLTSLVQIDVIKKRNDRVISSRIISVAVHGWITFPLTKTVRRWVRKRKNNKGIRIRIKSLYGTEKSVVFSTKNRFRREPMLVVFTKRIKGSSLAALLEGSSINDNRLEVQNNEKKRRHKRHLLSEDSELTQINSLEKQKVKGNEQKEDCQLKPLVVNTDQFELINRFFSPQYIDIKQCDGSCHYKKEPSYGQTNHGIFQSMASIVQDDKSRPDAPCCAPSAFEDKLMIAALRKGSTSIIKVVTLDKLIATKCACL